MRGMDNVKFSNISATPAAFSILGGQYNFDVTATFGGGNVVLNRLGPDGATYIPVGAAITANGTATYSLCPGQYQVAITTATAVYVNLTRVPTD